MNSRAFKRIDMLPSSFFLGGMYTIYAVGDSGHAYTLNPVRFFCRLINQAVFYDRPRVRVGLSQRGNARPPHHRYVVYTFRVKLVAVVGSCRSVRAGAPALFCKWTGGVRGSFLAVFVFAGAIVC